MARSIRTYAIVGSAIALGVLALASVVTAATPACVDKIAGTYYRPADFIMTLNRDRSLVGEYSLTTQEAIGLQESFSGTWNCSGQTVTIQSFHFLESGSTRSVERGNATGTFNGIFKIKLDYTFHVFDETASAADLRSAPGTIVSVPDLVVRRVSTP